MDVLKRWIKSQKADLATLKKGSLPGKSDDGYRMLKPVEYAPSEKRHRIGVLSLIAITALALLGALHAGSRQLTYKDATNGFTVGYAANMDRIENNNGFALFVNGDPESPRKLIAARGQLGNGPGFYDLAKEDRNAAFQGYVDSTQESNPDLSAIIQLEDLKLDHFVEEFDFLPEQKTTNDSVNEDGSIDSETTSFKVEGVRTEFSGRSQASGEPVDYAGEHFLYILADGKVANCVVMAQADIWEDSGDELLKTAGLK